MSRVSVSALVPGPVDEVRRLWFDPSRWPGFVDGFARVVRVEDPWPHGGRIVWDSTAHGRGRVVERMVADGVAEIEDAKIAGTQAVRFEDEGEGGDVRVVLQLDYRLKERRPLTPVLDVLFVRRAMADALRRTVARFAIERSADADADVDR